MTLALLGAWVMLTGAAWTDWTRRQIPNGWWLLGLGVALGEMLGGGLPWTHGLWAGGVWLVGEWRAWRHPAHQPGSLSWGDLKLITTLTMLLGPFGIWIAAWGSIGVYVGAFVSWWRHGRQGRWTGRPMPWAPGAWVALSVFGGFLWIMR